jgi:hypothetical protein
MGRRSIIPSSLIRKISSAINSERKLQYQNNLINSQHGDCKELPPKYSIQSVEFNEATRVAKLEILQTQNYRTINKYIKQNYVK